MKKLTTEEFIEKCKAIYGIGRYDYSKVEYIDNKTKVLIKCNKCGNEFMQSPIKHYKGGCRVCAKNQPLTTKTFIEKATNLFGDKYSYDKVEYKNAKTKIIIICNICGSDFEITPDHFLRGRGCLNCSRKELSKKFSKGVDVFIESANKKHGNGTYDYSKVKYVNNKTKVDIKCNKCGKYFKQTPYAHISRGDGCPICSISHGERSIAKLLDKNNIIYQSQKTFIDCRDKMLLPFDFYLPEYNLIVEFDGVQHFKPVAHFSGDAGFKNTQHHDNIKTNYCYDNDIILCRIKYNQDIFKELSKYIELKESV